MTEAQHQIALFKWSQQPSIRKQYPALKLLFHIPNGGLRDPIVAKQLQRQGVRPGVPDLFLPYPSPGGRHGLFIEMKAENGRLSAEQKWWLGELAGAGFYTTVCYGWQEAATVLEWYLSDGRVL